MVALINNIVVGKWGLECVINQNRNYRKSNQSLVTWVKKIKWVNQSNDQYLDGETWIEIGIPGGIWKVNPVRKKVIRNPTKNMLRRSFIDHLATIIELIYRLVKYK